jgi:hypothetical protein
MIQLLLDFCPGECSQKIAKRDLQYSDVCTVWWPRGTDCDCHVAPIVIVVMDKRVPAPLPARPPAATTDLIPSEKRQTEDEVVVGNRA